MKSEIPNEFATNFNSTHISRRDALKRTVVFSTGLLTAGWLNSLQAKSADTKFSRDGLHFLAIGDFGTGNATQKLIAGQMAQFAKKLDAPLTAVLALGDNFYKQLAVERFGPHFEEMYSKDGLDCPFYAILGNHDYGPKYDSNQGSAKAQIQLDYAKNNPGSRWKMPAKWYALELPDAENPLVKIILLDGSFFEGALTPKEKLAQKRWLTAELKKKTKAPWQWMISHYPIFTETSKRKDNEKLIQEWGGYLKANPFSLYLAGHDHNLQHLQVEDYKTSFVVCGAGGASLYDVDPSQRGFTEKILGFTHIHVTREKTRVQFINTEGRCLHAFQRSIKGKVEITAAA
jgi:tartrate-resistant acid phosphatase type 5